MGQERVKRSDIKNISGGRMKIEIKLDDPKYCDGCPKLNIDWNKEKMWCIDKHFTDARIGFNLIRPQECIDKFGE